MEYLHWCCGWLLALLQLSVLTSSCDGLSVTASFNQRGVSGTISFNQISPADSLNISVELNGLDLSTSDSIEWSVHSFPFVPSDPLPCPSLVGPLYQNLSSHILTQSSVQTFSDSNLTLFGRESIIGRSLLIKVNINESIVVCSTIGYASLETQLLWAPFRTNDIATGNVFLWQHTNQSVASILVNMTTILLSPVLWSILSTEGNNTVYNLTAVEGVACSHDNWTQCAVGDLSGRNGNLSVGSDGVVQQFVTDPGLPLDPVGGRPLALSSEERSVGAVIQSYLPVKAVAKVTEVGGRVEFTQRSPLEATQVVVTGLEGMQYGVHTLPPTADCSNTEGIFDPRGVGNTLEGDTLDFYQFGNLSGKFGSSQAYSDPYLPLSGRNSAIGRALVVTHDGVVSGCGLIRHAGDIVELKATLSVPGFSGTITFTQPAHSPFADTVITIETNITAEVEVFTSSPASSASTISSPTPSSSFYITPSQSAAGTSVTPSSPPATQFSVETSFTSSSPLATQLPVETSFPQVLVPFPTPSLASSSFLYAPTSLPFFILPSPTVLEADGSGVTESTILLSLEPTMGGRRRKRREAAAAEFRWSLRQLDGSTLPDDCSQLDFIGSHGESNCSPDSPLSCATGDLTGKHGPLPFGEYRAVSHDAYLPLSGHNGVVSAVLLVQPANGVGDSVCVAVTEVTAISATPTPTPQMTSATDVASVSPVSTSVATGPQTPGPSTTSTTGPPGSKKTGVDTAVLVGAVVGGVVGAGLLLAVLVLVMCVCLRKLHSGQVNLSKQGKKGKSDVELGVIRPHVEPRIGSDQYRALCPYQPQQSGTDDLPLEKGEWVTLLEAPYGGQWWRGQASAGEGWFPKTYVEYVDREAERKKAEEDNFKLAAAAIVAASSSFSLRHGSLATTKTKATSTNMKRSNTISKADIVTMPLETTKVDVAPGSVVIENDKTASPSTTSGSRPNTPHSPSGSDHVTGTSQESSDSSHAERILHLEPYLAKYNYVGGTEIELPLRKGEVVSVIEKAASGWWQGVCGGKVGWFPASYVKPVVTEEQKREEKQEAGALLGMEESLRSETLEATEYRAVHTFSSDQEGDLQFVKGDSILVYWVHDSGWWYGSKGSMQGWFPRTYVEPSVEGSEVGSAVPSPVPQSEEGSMEVQVAASSGESKSPAQRKQRKKWSFKRTKSQEEGAEDGHTPLIRETDKDETRPSPSRMRRQPKPRREAPPPPTTESSPPKATRATPPPLATPSFTELTLTTTSASNVTSPPQPVAMKRKRRTTASGVDPHKPRRLPPPPPSKTTPQNPPTITEAVADVKPPSGDATPVAPPRRKPRIRRVKRPSTRLIPPPPNIPLPPPPNRSIAASPVPPPQAKLSETASSQGTAVTSEPGTGVEAEGTTAVLELDDKKAGAGQETKTVATPAKPPVKPKPAHLSKRVTEPSLKLTPPNSTLISQSPPPAQGSPKPAPPARRSSLPANHPPPAKHKKPAQPLATVSDTTEETDSPQLQETAEAARNLRSAPPQHPPPPRPLTDDSTTRSSQKQRSNPPSFSPPQRPDSTTAQQAAAVPGEINVSRSSSIKARGTQLMRSLKRIVQRSEEGEEPEERSKVKVQEGEIIQNLQTESPVPQHRNLPGEAMRSPPARPPPPQLARTGSGGHNNSITASANGTAVSPPAGHTPQPLPVSTGSSPARSTVSPSRSTSPQLPTTFYRAKCDYTAQSPSELTFQVGDILVEIDQPTSAMYYGMLDDGTTGLFPASAVEPVVTPSNKK